jgi:hypothetical protein
MLSVKVHRNRTSSDEMIFIESNGVIEPRLVSNGQARAFKNTCTIIRNKKGNSYTYRHT